MIQIISNLYNNDDGQGLVEYAFILIFVAIVVIVALTSVGEITRNEFNNVSSEFPDV